MPIIGAVTDSREPIVRVSVRGPQGRTLKIDAVVDTGFTDYLTLPSQVIGSLELELKEVVEAQLADGSSVNLPIYVGWVEWMGVDRRIAICAAEADPLLGMALLQGSKLTILAVPGGQVLVETI